MSYPARTEGLVKKNKKQKTKKQNKKKKQEYLEEYLISEEICKHSNWLWQCCGLDGLDLVRNLIGIKLFAYELEDPNCSWKLLFLEEQKSCHRKRTNL